jgi:hypothetical protein
MVKSLDVNEFMIEKKFADDGYILPPNSLEIRIDVSHLRYTLVYVPFYHYENTWGVQVFSTYIDAYMGKVVSCKRVSPTKASLCAGTIFLLTDLVSQGGCTIYDYVTAYLCSFFFPFLSPIISLLPVIRELRKERIERQHYIQHGDQFIASLGKTAFEPKSRERSACEKKKEKEEEERRIQREHQRHQQEQHQQQLRQRRMNEERLKAAQRLKRVLLEAEQWKQYKTTGTSTNNFDNENNAPRTSSSKMDETYVDHRPRRIHPDPQGYYSLLGLQGREFDSTVKVSFYFLEVINCIDLESINRFMLQCNLSQY